MCKYRIRFNKSRGQPGRGTEEHVWRVLQGNTEWLARHVIIEVPSRSEQEGHDWNIVCEGKMMFFDDTDTVVITRPEKLNPTYNDKTLLIEEKGNIFGGAFNPWRVKRVEKLTSLFGLDWFKGKKILEMGCGHGNIGLYLESLGSTVHFSDAREEALAGVKKKKPDAVVFVIDQETEWRLEDHYDLIIHFGILYNLNYWEKDLDRVLSHCDYLALESAVHKFDNDNEYKITNYTYNEAHGPARQIGTLTSSSNIEKTARKNDFLPVRYDDKDLNVAERSHFSYSWEPEDGENAPKHGLISSWWDNPFCKGRRFWVMTKQSILEKSR